MMGPGGLPIFFIGGVNPAGTRFLVVGVGRTVRREGKTGGEREKREPPVLCWPVGEVGGRKGPAGKGN